MPTPRPAPAAEPLDADELRLLDAYWRAANYLSVGQIYLLDNPLLREALTREHVKPRLLGHFGTAPGLNLVYAHLNRAIRARDARRDLRHGPRARRAGERRERVPRGDVRGALPRDLGGRGRAPEAVPAVLVPRRHPEPRGARDARLDPRGRRARLRARPRVRRGLRQPRPPRGLRRRRRRGGDGAARRELALEQVPQPAQGRRRPPDPPPERLQDREPDRPRADPGDRARRALRGARLRAAPRHRRLRRRGPGGMSTSGSPPRSTGRSTRSPVSSGRPARDPRPGARAGR